MKGQKVQYITIKRAKLDAEQISDLKLYLIAKAALEGARRAFQDPEFVKGYEKWKAEKDRKEQEKANQEAV